MARSHKPVIWGLFAAGGTVAAFLAPVLILISCLAVPLGLLPPEILSYERLLELLQNPISRLVVFAVLVLIIWHAAHRLRITAHDVGMSSDSLVMIACYGTAAAGTLLAMLALFSPV